MDRTILHCDGNNFFASVEILSRPELASVPMAVTGDPADRHGIILAKNNLAKKAGVLTAETIYSARLKCPDLVCVPPHRDAYASVSRQVNEIYLQYSDLVEPFSIDESFLDLTGSLRIFGKNGKELADEIRERVRREIGITVSVGVSFCKVFAKLGSDYKKPDATTVFGREEIPALVYPLPVRELLFVGKRTEEQLAMLGIRTIGALASADPEVLGRSLGEAGLSLWKYANGLDEEPVRAYGDRQPPKSVSSGMTYRRDLRGREETHAALLSLCDEIAWELREDRLKCTVVQLSIKDPAFKTISRQMTLPAPTWLRTALLSSAESLLAANWRPSAPIRSLTVSVTGLTDPSDPLSLGGTQIDLFGEAEQKRNDGERQERLEQAVAAIQKKMGRDTLHLGAYDQRAIGVSNLKKTSRKEEDGTR